MATRTAPLETQIDENYITQKMIENNVWTINVDYDEKYGHNNINNA